MRTATLALAKSVLVEAPDELPVTLDEVKAWAHVDPDVTFDDPLIQDLIAPATEHVEKITGRQLIAATRRLALNEFPAGGGLEGAIWIPNPRLIEVVSVTYIDAGTGLPVVLPTADYQVDLLGEPGAIAPAQGKRWPSTRRDTFNAVVVDFECGYGTPEDVPATIGQAIMVLCAGAYAHRAPVDQAGSAWVTAAERMLEPYRTRAALA